MGAEYCQETISAKTDKEAQEAFMGLVAECEYDHGHSGYSGTFAEKTELTILPPPKGRNFWSPEELEHHEAGEDKWGPAVGGKISDTEYFVGGWCSS